MQVVGISQNSPAWVRARIGYVTASRMGNVMKKLVRSTNEAAERSSYRDELVVERLRGYAAEHKVTPDMQRGIDLQPAAAAAYEIEKGVLLDEGGWWLHDKIRFFGASPDYLLPDGKGLVEVKVPRSENHKNYVKYGWQEDKETNRLYEWQMRAQLACTGRQYVDFVSFDPSLPQKNLRLWIKRFPREDVIIRGMELEVEHFLGEVAQEVADLIHLPKVVVMQQAVR